MPEEWWVGKVVTVSNLRGSLWTELGVPCDGAAVWLLSILHFSNFVKYSMRTLRIVFPVTNSISSPTSASSRDLPSGVSMWMMPCVGSFRVALSVTSRIVCSPFTYFILTVSPISTILLYWCIGSTIGVLWALWISNSLESGLARSSTATTFFRSNEGTGGILVFNPVPMFAVVGPLCNLSASGACERCAASASDLGKIPLSFSIGQTFWRATSLLA